MKKLFIALLFLAFSINLYPQVIFYGGIKPFENNASNIQFYYVDQAPNPNSLYKNITFNKKELYNVGVTLGGILSAETPLYIDIGAQAFFNKIYGGDLSLQIGYIHPYFLNKRIVVFPTVGLGYGFYDLDIGDIQRASDYIQINKTKFYEKAVNVSLRNDFISLRPSLNVYFDLGKKVLLSLTGSYLYPFEFKDVARFYVTKDEKNSISESKSEIVDLTSSNLTMLTDGVKNTKLPYTFKGFEIRLGIGWMFETPLNSKIKKPHKPKSLDVSPSRKDTAKSNISQENNIDVNLKKFTNAQNAFNENNYSLVLDLLKDFPLDHAKYNDAIILMNKSIAKLPQNSNQNYVTVSGKVSCNCSKIINGYIVFEEVGTRLYVGKCRITSDGYYCIVLPSGRVYSYYIDAKDFYPVSRTIDFTNTGYYNHKDNLTIVSYEEMKEKQLAVRINNIFFDFNESSLKAESYPELDRLYNFLFDNSEIKVEISGHTDNVGTDEYNQNLSQLRANTVRNYLVNKGISSDRIIAKGYGESKPIATNDTDEGRQLNRRVEFKILK